LKQASLSYTEASLINELVQHKPVWILVISLELMDTFRYLGGMLGAHGDADVAVEAKVRNG